MFPAVVSGDRFCDGGQLRVVKTLNVVRCGFFLACKGRYGGDLMRRGRSRVQIIFAMHMIWALGFWRNMEFRLEVKPWLRWT
jgi:hypothetical protein